MADLLLEQHLTWINHLQPEGLVVAAHTLVDAGVSLRQDRIAQQREFLEHLDPVSQERDQEKVLGRLRDLRSFLREFLKWPDALVATGTDIPDSLRVSLNAFGDVLEPTLALKTPPRWPEALEFPYQVLVREVPEGTDFDKLQTGPGWQASAHARLERLLRETQVPMGILVSSESLRLVYAPRGENAGHLTFRFADLATVAGRSMLGALEMLLGQTRLISAATNQRLPALLKASREAQARVSAELSQQVLASLYELLRGFAEADRQVARQLLSDLVAREPQLVYQGLLSVLLRLVFLLYAEDSGLMPQTELYQESYSVHGLWMQLREDAAQYPDTMDQRFGAWARLVALFKAVYGGSRHPDLKLPPRLGHLFDPARFPFLEGPEGTVPLVPDGTLYRILENLLVLKGEKLSYRTLDVEQIGSVYESIMGFTLVTVGGLSLALRPLKKHGAPPVLNLEALLPLNGEGREKKVLEETDRKLNATQKTALRAARSVDALLDLFRPWQDARATPHPVPAGGWILVPTEERRKSGSHYTPRSLTAPVVEKALLPVWLRLGQNPTPDQILDLKICDPAMGSGAFLVEACRQVSERLVDSWKVHNLAPQIPPDEDELLHARRLVAQRCLYGVDRNPMAVDLAKLSLWLATLAKDHPFTFLDHSLRAGDSLVGLSRAQAVAFHWNPETVIGFGSHTLDERIALAQGDRLLILEAGDYLSPAQKADRLRRANGYLQVARDAANMTISAFFSSDKPKLREARRRQASIDWTHASIEGIHASLKALTEGEHPIAPFHWELEFPEVFFPDLAKTIKARRGFDAFVGNPPFAGKNTIASGNHPVYMDWLKALHEGSHGNADLSAHFFRRCFDLVREGGSFGLIATNTIAQGDTRSTGLRFIRTHEGRIYNAVRRVKWPGEAAVVVSTVHVMKSSNPAVPRAESRGGGILPILLDGRPVDKITAFLFHDGGDENPATLKRNADKSFQGSIVLGMGFTFDDTNPEATSIGEMRRLIEANPRNQERIFPYIGGEEVNDSPTHAHHRCVINFGEMPLCRASQAARWAPKGGTGIVADDFSGPVAADWPDLLEIVEAKLKGKRASHSTAHWWHFERLRGELYEACKGKERVLAIARVGQHGLFAELGSGIVFSEQLVVFPEGCRGNLSLLQSRIHELWARLLASSMKDDLRYTPSDCFETFPFPPNWETDPGLERVGRGYHDFRAALMVRHNEGLTKTYNRFHDPEHDGTGVEGVDSELVRADIEELRRLHSEMDRAVLTAYGWTDIDPTCQFLLDYEDDEDEGAPRAGRGRKKPWRLRFPDAVRDEILARLLELNAQYAREEGQVVPGAPAQPRPAKTAAKPAKRKAADEGQGRLL